MYNINSPITPNNNMGGLQGPPNYYFPGNGNMIGIGTYGYNTPVMNNGGYYTNNYNTMFNPYLMDQQRKAEEARALERARQNSDMMKKISRKVNHSLGNEISEEILKNLYDPVELRTSESDLIMQTTFRLIELDNYNLQNPFVYQNPLYSAMGRVQEKNIEKLNPEMDLHDFLEIGGELVSNAIKDEAMRRRKDAQALYNRSDYQKLIEARSGGSITFNRSLNPDANIDDMEISLPEHLKNEYTRRKALFMEKIINRGGV